MVSAPHFVYYFEEMSSKLLEELQMQPSFGMDAKKLFLKTCSSNYRWYWHGARIKRNKTSYDLHYIQEEDIITLEVVRKA